VCPSFEIQECIWHNCWHVQEYYTQYARALMYIAAVIIVLHGPFALQVTLLKASCVHLLPILLSYQHLIQLHNLLVVLIWYF